MCVQQGKGGDSTTVQADTEPRQVRSRWAEQLNPLTICSNFSPSPTKSQGEEEEQKEEEEEEDFYPQSLESLLGDEEEEGEEVSIHSGVTGRHLCFSLSSPSCRSGAADSGWRPEQLCHLAQHQQLHLC